MYDLNDTIVAVSTPVGGVRSIVRINGPEALQVCRRVFDPAPPADKAGIHPGSVRITDKLAVEALLYVFLASRSYTGDDLAEIHICAGQAIVEALVRNLLALGLRAAGPGEFTARAYLNGKLDLAQAEAVNEVVSSSNRLQLEAAERLLDGQLAKAADRVRSALLDILSLIEAGLDFSGEDIEFISPAQATKRLGDIQGLLEDLLAGSIRYETLLDLPSIGIAGAPNAGKSSLLNALLGSERSIVSHQPRTTRDVLSGVLITDRFQCVLFDCAGLIDIPQAEDHVGDPSPDAVLDGLAQRAAIEALNHCTAVLFCVDVAKTDRNDDITIRTLIRPKHTIHVATKSDLFAQGILNEKVDDLNEAFAAEFLAVSARTGLGLERLVHRCESLIADGSSSTRRESAVRHPPSEISTLALTARHKQAVTEAIENVRQAIVEVNRGSEEVAVMLIRAAHLAVSEIEQQPIDEQVLDRIFSRFCVGK